MDIPTIKTDRLVLRPFTEHDAEELHRILAQEGVLRYFPTTDPPPLDRVQKLIAAQLERWEEHGFGWWAVETHSHNRFIGWNGLQYLPETEEVEIGYLLDQPFWGQGLATEGARIGLSFGFDTIKLEEIIALVHPENAASQRVIVKLGMFFVAEAHYFGINVNKYRLEHGSFVSK